MSYQHDDDNNKSTNDTLAFDLLSSVDNDGMTDVVLISADGHRIPASRFVLGARSPVLRRLLFSNQVHSSKSGTTCNLPFSGIVVSALVEYCRTNDLYSLAQRIPRDSETMARQLIHVENFARAYQLPGLQERTCDLTKAILPSNRGRSTSPFYHLACAIFDEAIKNGANESGRGGIRYLALQAIRNHPEAALLQQQNVLDPPGVTFLGSAALQQILADAEMNCKEAMLFRVLLVWTNSSSDTGSGYSMSKRKEHAKSLVKRHIDLSRMAPSDLVGIVTESNLVDAAAIWNALKETALRAEQEHQVPLHSMSRRDCPRDDREMSKRRRSPPQQDDFFDPFGIHTIQSQDLHADNSSYQQSCWQSDKLLYESGRCHARNKNLFGEISPRFRPPVDFAEVLGTSPPQGSRTNVQATSTNSTHDSVPIMATAIPAETIHEISPTSNKENTGTTSSVAKHSTSAATSESIVQREKKGRVKGKLVLLAEKMDNMCLCGASPVHDDEVVLNTVDQ